MTERNDDPIADIKAAVDEAVERMFSDKLSVEDYARLINRVFDNLPDFFKQPLQPVPEPLPWLDQPDGEGLWWTYSEGVFHVAEVVGKKYARMGIECEFRVSSLKAKWQRIPQPVLPGEAGK